jgi:hypothetical protein
VRLHRLPIRVSGADVRRLLRTLSGPLALALLPLLAFGAILFSQRWIPRHDTLHATEMSHQFWSALAYAHEVPTWAPHAVFGRPTQLINTGFLPLSVWLLAPVTFWYKGWNAARLFYLAQLLNETLLVIGAFALGTRLYRNKAAALFIALTLGGTALWAVQIYFNFLIDYSLPLCLYLAVRGLQERRLFLVQAGVWALLVTCSIGDALYPAILQGLVFSSVLAALAWQDREGVRALWSRRVGPREAVGFALLLTAVVVPLVSLLHAGLPAVTGSGRDASGVISYDVFLHYADDPFLRVFSGFFNGVTLHNDLTVYGGLLLTPLVLFSLLFGDRRQVPFVVGAAWLLLFYVAETSFVAPLLHLVPGVSLYRHISYAAPHVKLMLVLVAGFGFDELVERLRTPVESRRQTAWLLALLALTLAAFLYQSLPTMFPQRRVLLCVVGLLGCIVATLRARLDASWARFVAPVLLLVVAVDAYSQRSFMLHRSMRAVDASQWALFRLKPLRFVAERSANPFRDPSFVSYWSLRARPSADVDQALAFDRCARGEAPCAPLRSPNSLMGMPYDSIDGFLGRDACAHVGLVYLALPWSLGQITPYWPPHPQSSQPARALTEDARLSMGCERPKLQFYDARQHASEAPPLALEPTPDRPVGAPLPSPPFDVVGFSSNRLALRLRAPLAAPAWLYYADSWDRGWAATVDGRPAKVYRARGAFKAVLLGVGAQRVEFRHAHALDTVLAVLIWCESAALYGLALWWAFRRGLQMRFDDPDPRP